MEKTGFYEFVGFAPPDAGETITELPHCDLSRHAVFLDFDGTLVDIAEKPDAVTVPPALPDLLRKLSRATQGATAIVSGRSVETVRALLPDFQGAIAGSHGGEICLDGTVERHHLAGSLVVDNICRMAIRFAETIPGLLAENKPTGVVLHYRMDPEAEPHAHKFMQALCECYEEFDLHHAKMAYELRPKDVGKDKAIRKLMATKAFAGRIPVYFGDDRTDEAALMHVRDVGGISVKIGDEDTSADFRVAAPDDVRAALLHWCGDAE